MARSKNPALHSQTAWTAAVAVAPSTPGALAGWESTCTHCAWTISSTLRANLDFYRRDHDRTMVRLGR